MEVMGAAVGALVATTSELLCSCVISKTKTTSNLHSNLASVEKEMERLMDRRKEVNLETEAAKKEGNEIKDQVVTWLEEVEKLRLRVDAIQGQMVNNKKPSRCFLNCRKQYRASGEVEETLKQIKGLLVDGNFDYGVATRVPRAVEFIPAPSIQGQNTALKKLDETMRALSADGVQVIGIWGLGGVGKTTLVKNLNNELKKASTQPFDIIIWATVSKNFVIKNVQTQIAERLDLEVKKEESIQRMASRLYQRLENEAKFLLILDDVWAKIDLGTLGVPGPEVHKGCKIILTSRLMEVCRTMTTDVEIKMDVLNDEEAWKLFCQKAGDVAHLEEIRPLAEAIVKECCRLPLAIIIVGAAMRKKTKVELWKHALKELRRSMPSIEGIETEVYKPLKLSYDSLQGNKIKSCFLCCCLFPEDFKIEIRELVKYWRAEGLIGEGQNWEDMEEGISLIENLKDSCLLEDAFSTSNEKTVKMHDVVRDVAIWISSSSEDGYKSLVRSGIGLREISVGEFSNSNSLNRVSFMHNNITRLPDCMIQCSKASALLLQGNRALNTIPEKFLQGFEALKVLNLSGTGIRSLPHSLCQLRDLRVLILCLCSNLEDISLLGTLSNLRELNLYGTCITNLPREIENLSELRLLNLAMTSKLKSIQPGIISKLSCLESLSMWQSAFRFRLKGEEDGQATFEELKSSFNQLHYLNILFDGIPWDKSEDLSWIYRISHLQLQFDQAQGRSVLITIEKRCFIENLNFCLSQEWIGWFWGNSSSLELNECTGLIEMLEGFIESDASFVGLKSLSIARCPTSLGRGGCAGRHDLLPNLEELHLYSMKSLNSISELAGHLGLRFHSLKSIEVFNCSQMKYVLCCGDYIQTLPNLEVIMVNQCKNLEELFNNESGQNMALDPIVPKLRILELKGLPKLVTLCRHEEKWPCLEQIKVELCFQMKYLLSCGDFIQTLPNLEVIKVNECEDLEELFHKESGQNMTPDPMVPKLRILELKNLPKLETLCRHEETWPCLEQVEVWECYRLRRLPLTNQNVGTIKEIIGESQWRDALEWDDEQTKSSLLPIFNTW